MENKECTVKRVSGTHLKPYIAVQSGNERRNSSTKTSVEKKVKVLNWANWIVLLYGSSNLLRLWRTCANELYYEAKEMMKQ